MEKFSIAPLEGNQVLNTEVLYMEDHSDWRRVKSVSDKCYHCHPVVPHATAYVCKIYFLQHIREKHISPWYKTSAARKLHFMGLRELKYCLGLHLGIYIELDIRF